jgi:hypothetical protein
VVLINLIGSLQRGLDEIASVNDHIGGNAAGGGFEAAMIARLHKLHTQAIEHSRQFVWQYVVFTLCPEAIKSTF